MVLAGGGVVEASEYLAARAAREPDAERGPECAATACDARACAASTRNRWKIPLIFESVS